jgi:hypothetical protein
VVGRSARDDRRATRGDLPRILGLNVLFEVGECALNESAQIAVVTFSWELWGLTQRGHEKPGWCCMSSGRIHL